MSLLTKKVGVIAAQIEEIEPLIKQLDVRENSDTMFPTWEAKYHNQELLIQVVGIGKVNSSIAVQRMIHLYEVGSIYMIGIAGGLKEGLGIGDVVIGKNLIQSDFDTSVFGYDIGQIPKIDCRFFSSQDYFEYITAVKEKFAFNVVQGNYVTQDKFLTCSKTAEKLQTSFQAFAVDMEAAADAYGEAIHI